MSATIVKPTQSLWVCPEREIEAASNMNTGKNLNQNSAKYGLYRRSKWNFTASSPLNKTALRSQIDRLIEFAKPTW